jgi:hypothetical protein
MDTAVDNVLAHFGKKGMKWGVRNSSKGSDSSEVTVSSKSTRKGPVLVAKGGKNLPPDEVAKIAAAVNQKAKVSGISSVSNTDLKVAVDRMNMEQSYKRAVAANQSKGVLKTAVNSIVKATFNNEVKSLSKGNQGPVLKQIKVSLDDPYTGKHIKK